jgi:hypothetical protein
LHGWLSSFEASIAAKLWPGSRRTTMLDWFGAQTEHSQPGGEGLEQIGCSRSVRLEAAVRSLTGLWRRA